MARKSRKNMPVAVAEPTDNLTTKAVLSMDKEAKPYQVGIYTRLSFESEANKERDTVDTQIAYIREFINGQDDMVEVCVYADISVTGTIFERPEFDRMIQDIRAGKINTVITRDLSRLGRNYVEAGNYIERVFPFLDVRYIAITDDFDTARPGTDLSVPLAKGFREAGQTVTNAFRTFADKPEVDYSQKEQKHPITKAVLAPMKAVKKMLVLMEIHLDASIDKLDNLAMDVQLDKEKHMENAKAQK